MRLRCDFTSASKRAFLQTSKWKKEEIVRVVFLKENQLYCICKDKYFNHFICISKAKFSVVYTSNRQQHRICNCINTIIVDTSTTWGGHNRYTLCTEKDRALPPSPHHR